MLLPATMKLLGDRNWYLPTWLEWLPRLDHEGSVEPKSSPEIGLAAAILIDATIVRAVLLPATMTLLGDRNWYLPSWLEWLPRLDHDGSVDAPKPQRGPGLGPVPEPAGA